RVLGPELEALPTPEQLNQLPYVTQVLKECLRLWPTAPSFRRHPLQNTLLGGRYPLQPESEVMVLIPMLHRDPSVWGEDAERFDPDHFSPEAERKLPPNAYKPFGSGQRSCIGRAFAMQEATLVLAKVLQRFELIDHLHYQLRLRQTLTL